MHQEFTETCVTFVGNNWWTREGFFAVGGGLEDGDMFHGRSQDFSKRGVTLCQTLSSWRFRHGIL